MQQRRHGESIAERLVDDVPEMKNFLRTREEQESLRKRSFLGGGADNLFQLTMTSRKKPRESLQ